MKKVNLIEVRMWDDLVKKTYGKPYSFQQQDDCKPRGIFKFSVPSKWKPDDFENDEIPMVVNGSEMGVSFKAWLEKDPSLPVKVSAFDGSDTIVDTDSQSDKAIVWERNFYPNASMIIEDLAKKGLLEDGDYIIEIDW